MSANNGGIKKMSLEEFLGDDSLGDSVWNEDDINLEAISNTTNIDILKTKTHKQQGGGNAEVRPNPFGYRSPPPNHGVLESAGNNTNKINSVPMGPPYIVKFSQLPQNFASVDIDDLFHEKFTKFTKCKMFWELNPNPSIATLNSGTIFEQNFKRENKVAFVEVITGRDMDKILKYWTQPLLKYYNIKVEPAQFEDFNEYNAKVKLLTDPRDDASKPYVPPKPRQSSKSSKSNPFGSAKPVDTQSKILDIEEKVGKLHVEDTSTLRRISGSEPNNPQHHHQRKVTLLKKPHEEESASSSSSAIEEPPAKPLSYLQVIKKTAEETKKSPSSSSATTRLSSPATNPASIATATAPPAATAPSTTSTNTTNPISTAETSSTSTPLEKESTSPPSLENGAGKYDNHNNYQQQHHHNNYHNNNHQHQSQQNNGEDRPYYKRTSFSDNSTGFRGRGGGRGGSFRRGNGPRGGGGFRNQNQNRRGGPSNYNNSSNGSFNNYNDHQQDGKNYPQDEKHYSIFKPASGFLWENGNDKSINNHSQRGGGSSRGSYRGGRNRRNNGFTTV